MEHDVEEQLETVTKIRANLQAVQERIDRAAQTAGRNLSDVNLVVVSKAQPVETVRAAVQAGARLFGENYAEHAVPKIETFRGAGPTLEWHMIGHIQSRKASLVAQNFDMVHSLDSLKLARRLDNACSEIGRTLPVLLEFNVGGEDSKSGWLAAHPTHWEGLLDDVEAVLGMERLRVCGLMTMPPYGVDPEQSRPYFQLLVRLRNYLANRFPGDSWQELSIGTSSDYQVAVEEGATLVRVGQAILGPRTPK